MCQTNDFQRLPVICARTIWAYLTVFTAWWCMPMSSLQTQTVLLGVGRKCGVRRKFDLEEVVLQETERDRDRGPGVFFSFSFLSSIPLPLSFFLPFVSHCHQYRGILIKPTTGIYPDCEYNPAPSLLRPLSTPNTKSHSSGWFLFPPCG